MKVAQSRQTDTATLVKRLHRELEWIPLKAMRKERDERYRSASELADDVENYLNGTPLIAGPPSTLYRLKKSIRRNKALVAGTFGILAVSVIGAVVSLIFAFGQVRALAKARLIAGFLEGDVLSSARQIIGREATVRDVLAAASKNLENRFSDEPLVEGSIRETLGRMYFDLGDFRSSALHRERAYRIYLNQFGEEHGTTRNAMNWLAVSYNFVGKYREAEELWEALIQQRDEVVPGLKCNLAVAYARQGRYEDAERVFLEAFETAGWGPDHSLTLLYAWDLAKVYREQGRYKDAEDLFVKTLEGQRQRFGEKGEDDMRNMMMMIRCMNELARLYVIQNRYDEAEALFTEGIELGNSQLPGKDHPFTLRHVNGLGVLRTKRGNFQEAEALFNRAFEGRKLKLGEDHPYTLETTNDLGLLRHEQRRYEEAEKLITEALEGRRAKLGPDHPHTLQSMHELAALCVKQNQHQQAADLLVEAAEGRLVKLGAKHPHTQESLNLLIDLYKTLNQPDEAEEWRSELAQRDDTEKQ